MTEVFKTEFNITPGSLIKGMTGFVIILFIFIVFIIPLIIYYFENEIFPALLVNILTLIIFIPMFIFSWAYSPKSYSVSEKGIGIHRPLSSIFIPLNEIKKVEDKEISAFKTIRLWANGGIFSLSGAFYNKQDGKFWMYAKNNRYVMIHANKKYVVSPDEKEQFIIKIKNHLGRLKRK